MKQNMGRMRRELDSVVGTVFKPRSDASASPSPDASPRSQAFYK
jgi:hypothetical protein